MPTYEVTQDGKTFEVDVPEGQDPNTVISQVLGTQSLGDAAIPEGTIPTLGDVPVRDPSEARFVGDFERQTGLGLRSIAGAIPKAGAGLADLAAMVLNLPLEGIDRLGQAMGDDPIDARLPTTTTQTVDALLDEIFPSPETLTERIVTGTGEVVLSGGAGAAALAPRAGQVAKAPSTQGILRNLGDEIGEFFAKDPKKFAAIEAAGGAGAITGGELADEAELGPGGQLAATVVGGLAGGVTPQAAINVGRRSKAAVMDSVPGLAPSRRAAVELQSDVADPQAAAQAAREAPEGITPAQAADSPTLRAKEQRVLEDDPELAARVESGRLAAEERTLDELATQFGPGTDRQVWEQSVVSRAAPDGADIPVGEVDDMVRSAANEFNKAYREIDGFPIQDQVVRAEGGNVPLRETITDAAGDPAVLTGDTVRARVASWLEGRYNALVDRGTQVGGSADQPVNQVDSSDLLELRQVIRTQQRQKFRAGLNNADAAAEAQLLDNAERAVTDVLESQLPAEVSAALRATDARYADFKAVEDAVARSGDKGLTPQALQSAINRRSTPGQVARGETGDLGTLAAQGRNAADLLKPSTTDAQARRLVRDMSPEQLQGVKSDLNAELAARSSQRNKTPVDGKKYLKEIEGNEARLRVAGFEDADLNNMRRIGRELQMIQSRNPRAVEALLTDNVGSGFRLLAAIAGSRAGTRILQMTGGATGAGPSLILAQFGSRQMQEALTSLSVDKADELIRAAMTDRDLFAALMTKPTDTIKAQADSARVIQAWLTQAGAQPTETDNE